MSLMAANEESDPSAILNGFWVTLTGYLRMNGTKLGAVSLSVVRNEATCSFPCRNAWSGT